MNSKSDNRAKEAYKQELIKSGYENVKIIAAPADISAELDGKQKYFEIKKTRHKDKYFGAATFTEWEQAFVDPDNFRFVIAMTDEKEEEFEFIEFSPAEFIQFSTIPPLKVFFNINLKDINKSKKKDNSKAVWLTESRFRALNEIYQKIKQGKLD